MGYVVITAMGALQVPCLASYNAGYNKGWHAAWGDGITLGVFVGIITTCLAIVIACEVSQGREYEVKCYRKVQPPTAKI